MERILTYPGPDAAASFEAFYRDKREHLARSLVMTLGSRDLGLEATDEAFTRAYQHWDKVKTYDNPTGWVYRVGLNWARTKLRRSKREIPSIYLETAVEHFVEVEPGLDAAMAKLPEKHRSVVVLRYYMDWSLEEIATSLRIPKGTVKSRLHRAIANLQHEIGAVT